MTHPVAQRGVGTGIGHGSIIALSRGSCGSECPAAPGEDGRVVNRIIVTAARPTEQPLR